MQIPPFVCIFLTPQPETFLSFWESLHLQAVLLNAPLVQRFLPLFRTLGWYRCLQYVTQFGAQRYVSPVAMPFSLCHLLVRGRCSEGFIRGIPHSLMLLVSRCELPSVMHEPVDNYWDQQSHPYIVSELITWYQNITLVPHYALL